MTPDEYKALAHTVSQAQPINKRGVRKLGDVLPDLKPRKYGEDKLQMKIIEHHTNHFPHVLITHPAQTGRSPQEGAKLKKLGVRAGVSDLLLWWENNCGAVEIKTETGKESIGQKTFGFLLKRLGHHYGVARSVEEYHNLLVSWGIKPAYECRYFAEPDYATKQEKFQRAYDWFRP